MRNDAEPKLETLQFNLRSAFAWLTAAAVLFAVLRFLPLPREIAWANLPMVMVSSLAVLVALFFVARSAMFNNPIMVGWVGTWFGGAVFGILVPATFFEGISLSGVLFCAVIGFFWAALASVPAIFVVAFLDVAGRPRGNIWPSALCGAIAGATSTGIIAISNMRFDPIGETILICLFPAIVGSATAVFATIVHLWAKRNRQLVRVELPERIEVPDRIAPPSPEVEDEDESFRLRDELEKPWRMKRW